MSTVFTTQLTKTYCAFKSDTHFVYSTIMHYPLTKGKSITSGQDFGKRTGVLKKTRTYLQHHLVINQFKLSKRNSFDRIFLSSNLVQKILTQHTPGLKINKLLLLIIDDHTTTIPFIKLQAVVVCLGMHLLCWNNFWNNWL